MLTSDGAVEEEPIGLVIVWLLAALAGSVDACGVSLLTDLYVSFMSGNTTSLGAALAKADWPRAGLIASIIAAFVGGAASGEVIARLVGRLHLPVVILSVAGILGVALAVPSASILALTFAMGALNAAMQRAGNVKVSITYVTGTLVKFGQGLGRLLCGEMRDWTWLKQAVPWSGLLAGAVAATLALASYGGRTLIGPPFAALALAAATWFAQLRTKPP